jgi:hypothetical protein
MLAFRETQLAATIPVAFEVSEKPTIDGSDALFQLRE